MRLAADANRAVHESAFREVILGRPLAPRERITQ